MASWSRDGIAGLQSVVLYSLPELDGAIDTVPLGGLVGDNIFLVSERVTRLSQRIKKWVHLRRSQPQVSPIPSSILSCLYGIECYIGHLLSINPLVESCRCWPFLVYVLSDKTCTEDAARINLKTLLCIFWYLGFDVVDVLGLHVALFRLTGMSSCVCRSVRLPSCCMVSRQALEPQEQQLCSMCQHRLLSFWSSFSSKGMT